MQIVGGNNPQNTAHVDSRGRVQARSASLSEQEQSSLDGEAFNLNTGTVTLTNDTETGMLYLKNNGSRDLSVKRVFFNIGASTGGSGEIYAKVYANPTTGTLITAGTELVARNFNTGSNKVITGDIKQGATGSTVTNGTVLVDFLIPSDSVRISVPFEAIIIPQGSAIAISFQAPSGNTSIPVQVGINCYIELDQGNP